MFWSKISIICTLRCGFLNDLDSQSDFDKKNCHKKAGQVEPCSSNHFSSRIWDNFNQTAFVSQPWKVQNKRWFVTFSQELCELCDKGRAQYFPRKSDFSVAHIVSFKFSCLVGLVSWGRPTLIFTLVLFQASPLWQLSTAPLRVSIAIATTWHGPSKAVPRWKKSEFSSERW